MRVLRPWFLTGAFLVWPSFTLAQNPAPPVTMSLDDVLQSDVRTVVGASRYRQRVIDAPASVTIVTAEEIARFGYRTLSDVLRGVRGFYVTYDRNYSYLGVRGFSPPGDYNTRILFLLNGHRLNDNVYDAVLIGTEFPLDIALIERVEVIRGPTSTIYGTNAFFGVVNIVTKDAGSLGRLTGSLEGGSLETRGARATLAHGFAATDVVASFSGFRSAGQTAIEDPGLAATATGMDEDRAWNSFVSAERGAWHIQALASSRQKRIPTGAYGTLLDDPRSVTTDSRFMAAASFQKTIGRSDVTWRAAYDRFGYEGTYAWAEASVTDDRAKGDWLSTSASASRRLGTRHYASAGTDARMDVRQEQFSITDGAIDVDVARRNHSVGFWIADEVTVSSNLLLHGSLSQDWYESFGATSNVRLAAILKPWSDGSVKLLYGTAFRAPNAYELYYYGYGQSSRLDPERVKTLEVAFEQQVTPTFRVAAVAFHSASDHLITMRSVDGVENPGFALAFRNADAARTRGTEVESELQIGNVFRAFASYSYQRANYEATDVELSNAPRHMFQAHGTATLGPVTVGVETISLGRRLSVQGESIAGWWLTNLTVTPTQLSRAVGLSFSVHNLFNRPIEDPGGEEHPQPTIPQDGRTARVRLTWSF